MNDFGVGMGAIITVPCDDGWRAVLVASYWQPEVAASSTLAEAQAFVWAISLLEAPHGHGTIPPLDIFDEIPNYKTQERELLKDFMPGFPKLLHRWGFV